MTWPKITPAKITWQDGAPVSKDFGDVYALPGKAAREKDYVFLQGVRLEGFLAQNGRVSVGELGFGTGLNFLLTLEKALKAGKCLDYLAIEGFPLSRDDLEKALGGVSGAKGLLAAYPPLVPGFHRLNFAGGKITLTLVFGEVLASLKQVSGNFDAWYLDGFSPDKNPAMWTPGVFRQIARLSAKGARLATFSAAGAVRRGLEEAGFEITRRPGFDRKRESLSGTLKAGSRSTGLALGTKIAVVGGGIAGCSAAYALNQKGYEVTLFEKADKLAAGTSGHPLAVFKPKLQKTPDPYGIFLLAAYLYSLGLFETLDARHGGIWHPLRGDLQIPANQPEEKALIALGGLFPGFGVHVRFEKGRGLVFPKAGAVIPGGLCRALTSEIEVVLGREYRPDPAFKAVIYATGHRAFEAFGKSPFRTTRGQVNFLPAAKQLPLRGTLSFPGGYLTPEIEGRHILGTSFKVWGDPEDKGWEALSRADFEKNLAGLEKALGKLPAEWRDPPLSGRTALRAETQDHLPVAGAAFDEDKYRAIYAKKQSLHHSLRQVGDEANIPGVFVLSGFGSRGFVAAPYAAEILSCQIAGTPLPCPRVVKAALEPARFLEKNLKRG